MKRFALTLVIAASIATSASAFSVSISLPNLTFPPTDSGVASQSCVAPAQLPGTACK